MRESYDVKVQSLQDRLSRVQQEYDNANDDRLHHVDSINALTKKLQNAEQERDAMHRKFMKEVCV
jgi:phage shock protein A